MNKPRKRLTELRKKLVELLAWLKLLEQILAVCRDIAKLYEFLASLWS
jgi:hypothetical protein